MAEFLLINIILKFLIFNYQFPISNEISNSWKIYTNDEYGFEFEYPESFSNQLAKVNTKECIYDNFLAECPNVKNILSEELKEEGINPDSSIIINSGKKNYNNNYFCLYKYGDMAAGTTYSNEFYVISNNKNCITIKFVISYPNCQNYLPIEQGNIKQKDNYDNCLISNQEKPKTIEKILSTFKFTTPVGETAIFSEKEEIIGFWSMGLASSFSDSYNFFPSGKYGFKISGMDCESRDRGHSGYWKIKNDKLILTVVSESKLVGGILVPAAGSCASKYQISKGEEKVYLLKTPKTYEISITTCFPPDRDETDPYDACLSFNGGQFDKYTSNPYDDNYYFEINEPTFEE